MSGLTASLSAFLKAGVRPRTPLARAVVAALVLKLCVVVAMRVFLFGADARPAITEASLTQHLGPAAAIRLP